MKLEYMVVSPTTSFLNAFLRLFQAIVRDGSYSSVSPSPCDVLAPRCAFGPHGVVLGQPQPDDSYKAKASRQFRKFAKGSKICFSTHLTKFSSQKEI